MSNGCPFCNPAPDRLFHQSELVIGLWDNFPVTPGHALVLPRRHVASWFEATLEEQAALLQGINQARAAICERYQPDGFNIGVNVNEAAGQTIFHLHVHVIPRYRGDVINPRGGVRHVIPKKADYTAAQSAPPPAADQPPHDRPLVRGEHDPLLPHLRADLDRAHAADIAVAFVVRSGIRLVVEHFRDLLARGGRIRFLTGDYLDVTEPEALLELIDLDGQMELRVFEARTTSFHPKAFILHFPDGAGSAYVGSSNLTETALKAGIEWNYRVVTSADQAGYNDVLEAFEAIYRHRATRPVNHAWIESYRRRRRPAGTPEQPAPPLSQEPPPEPHPVQREALLALEQTRSLGNSAGLVVLATGLGKTWLSAFDTDRPEFRTILFVAHRDEILGQAIKTFRRVRPAARIGRYDGTSRDLDADILFASVMTLGRTRHRDQFTPGRFDYIIVDEFHHAAARTYRNLIDYFRPKFLLGLTATPERTDGGDLLALCQENLVYRCDVFEAIARGLLCPFKYYGVPDEVDYSNIPWRSSRFDEEALTAALATRQRAQNALEQYQRFDERRGQRRTLAFCCSQRHADFMADYFQSRGVRSVAVHSGPTTAPRAGSLERLGAGTLDVVFAVDMFNEGVDLPSVDTVLMLRPTESAVLWQQQFGRGLRLAEGKSHLTVIDYIGNHRVFLTKVRSLFRLGLADQEIDQVLNLLVHGQAGLLPPGCEVTYQLEAIQILRSLLRTPIPAEVLKAYYLDYKERHGQRPTAVEAFHDGYNPRSLRPLHGSWLRFVRALGDLDPAQGAVLEEQGAFLDTLETTPMSKSFKMLTLLAMLNEDRFPGQIEIGTLTAGFRLLAERSAVVRSDVGPALEDDAALKRLLLENPITFWSAGRGTGGHRYFAYTDGRFRTTFEVRPEHRQTFRDLVREIADWRMADYLARRGPRPAEPSTRTFECKVSHSGGRPILFLPDRVRYPWIPSGWIKVLSSAGELKANFVQVAVNVMRRPGDNKNVLSEVLRGWFGPDVGRPGTRHHVLFEAAEDGWRMAPQSPVSEEPHEHC